MKNLSSNGSLPAFASRVRFAAFLAASFALGAASQAVNVTTSMNDNNRSGLNDSEFILTPSSVNSTNFGKLFTQSVDMDIYSQPLYVEDVSIGGGMHNVVYISTMNNTLYAFDADNDVSAYWSEHLATPVPQGDVDCCCTDVATEIGINSTGVIDLSTNTWYVVVKQKNSDSTYHQFLHAVDITSGAEKFGGPVEISGSNGGVSFDPKLNNQRAALLLQGGNVYWGCASHNDCGNYHGFLFGYSAATLSQVGVWASTTNSGALGGIWMAGGGLAGDGTSIYCTTGNGDFNGNTGGTDFGMSAVRLNSSLVRQDYFTPYNWSSLSGSDLDLAGGGVMLIPGAERLLVGGKPGEWHLINTTSMGGFNASENSCLQTLQITNLSYGDHHLHHGPAFFNNTIYVGGESDYLKAYSWNGTSISTSPTSETAITAPLNTMPGWQQFISANGTSNGIVWATKTVSGDANHSSVPGIMYAYNAGNLATELYDTYQNETRDNFGNFAKNPAPIVANGKVYCPTFSNQLCVYGMLNTTSSTFYFYEGEALAVHAQTAGVTARVGYDNNMSGGAGAFLDATAVGQFVSYDVPNIQAGTYDVRVGMKEYNNRGQWQLSVQRLDGTGSSSNVGGVVDGYTANATYTFVDLGDWTPGTTSDKAFKFTVTGKNASSTDYEVSIDYIELIKQ